MASQQTKIAVIMPLAGPLAPAVLAWERILDQATSGLSGALGSKPRIVVCDVDILHALEPDLVLTCGTAAVTGPVTTACAPRSVPCLSTMVPWEAYVASRPDTGFSFHFFAGLEQIKTTFDRTWADIGHNGQIDAWYSDDADGRAWGDPAAGFPATYASLGLHSRRAGFVRSSADLPLFHAQANGGILLSILPGPQFWDRWRRARGDGAAPRVVSTGRSMLSPLAASA